MHMMPLPRHASAHCAWNRPCGASLADQTLTRGESLVKFLSSSQFQHAKGMLIGLVTNGGAWLPFLACCLEQGVITEDLPLQNASQFMFTPTSLDALMLSMQYKSLMGI